MKLNWKRILRNAQCSMGMHAWARTTSSPDYLAGFNTRACGHCPTTQVFVSDLGRWVNNKR
jgi:hypothetical protein